MTLIPIRKHEGSFHRSCYFTQWPRLRCFRLVQWSSLSQQHVMRQLSVVPSGENAEFMETVDTWQRPWGTWARPARSPACKPSHRHIDTCLMTAGFASSDATSFAWWLSVGSFSWWPSHESQLRTSDVLQLQPSERWNLESPYAAWPRGTKLGKLGKWFMGKKMADLIW